jgi:hypothetical protein
MRARHVPEYAKMDFVQKSASANLSGFDLRPESFGEKIFGNARSTDKKLRASIFFPSLKFYFVKTKISRGFSFSIISLATVSGVTQLNEHFVRKPARSKGVFASSPLLRAGFRFSKVAL